MQPVPIDHDIRLLDGDTFSLGVYRGLGLLVVNIGSHGPHADQLSELGKLYDDFDSMGLMVIGVPSNDFGGEPGDETRVRARYELDLRTSFPVTQRMRVSGPPSSLFRALTSFDGQPVHSDAEKFVIDGDGYVVERFSADVRAFDARIGAALKLVLPTMGY